MSTLYFLHLKLSSQTWYNGTDYDIYIFLLLLAIDINTGIHLLRWFWKMITEERW